MFEQTGPIHYLASGLTTQERYTYYPLFKILKIITDEFAATSEKIVKELKFNDDGYRLTMLEMLQETVKDESKLKEAAAKVAVAQHALNAHKLEINRKTKFVSQLQRQLNDASLRNDNEEEMRLEIELGQAKTELFLMKNMTFKLQGDLSIVQKELAGIEFHHNKVWSDIIVNETQGKSKQAKFNSIKKR